MITREDICAACKFPALVTFTGRRWLCPRCWEKLLPAAPAIVAPAGQPHAHEGQAS